MESATRSRQDPGGGAHFPDLRKGMDHRRQREQRDSSAKSRSARRKNTNTNEEHEGGKGKGRTKNTQKEDNHLKDHGWATRNTKGEVAREEDIPP